MLLANVSLEHQALSGLSANWFGRVSDAEACLWALSVLWAFLPVGSDVRVMVRAICEDGVLFGRFAHWF